MGIFTVGEVVLVPFPYADFSKLKKRPALVIGEAEFNNLILCQITSKVATSKRTVTIEDEDFESGSLPVTSYARYDKIFTVEQSIVASKLGALKTRKLETVRASVRGLFA